MILDRRERGAVREILLELLPQVRRALQIYLGETSSATELSLTTKGPNMTVIPVSNYPLAAGDSVVVTVVDTDVVTGLPVTPDAGSVTAVLSSTTDTVVVDPTGTFATITAGTVEGTGNTVTVNASYKGALSTPVTGTYDVVAAVVSGDATALSVSFGTETPPATSAPLDAAQLAALVTAGIPFVSFPLDAAQSAALVTQGVPYSTTTSTPAALLTAPSTFTFNEVTGTYEKVAP